MLRVLSVQILPAGLILSRKMNGYIFNAFKNNPVGKTTTPLIVKSCGQLEEMSPTDP